MMLTAASQYGGSSGKKEKLYREKLYGLYSTPNIIQMTKSRRIGWAGYVARMEGKRNGCRSLMGKPEAKRPLGRPRRIYEGNTKLDLKAVLRHGVVWIHLPHYRAKWQAVVSSVMNFRVPYMGNSLTS
jgi:hypothetical protein